MKTIYLISGPLGVGKTTVAKALTDELQDSSLIVGDDFYNAPKYQELEWDEKLRKAWSKILEATKQELSKHQNIVVDFVVEDELPWFKKELGKDIQIKYVVLMAEEKTTLHRLKKRGELKYKDRSLVLLNQLKNDPANDGHILDTTKKSVPEIVKQITRHF